MEKIALLVIYNHRYDKNILKVESLYGKSFQYLFHVIPFYDGEKENVIPVYESSYCFQGYIAQAYQHIKKRGFTHFLIIADDLLLNPKLDENNFFEKTGLKPNQSFISELVPLQQRNSFWFRFVDALEYNPNKRGVEIMNIIPTTEDAQDRFKQFGLDFSPIKTRELIKHTLSVKSKRFIKASLSAILRFKRTINLKYPLVGAYSDMLMLPSGIMDKFVTYSGAFAATDLFVELAIPTTLVLCTDEIALGEELILNKRLHKSTDDYSILDGFNFNLSELCENFPEKYLFLHPIKLSKWH